MVAFERRCLPSDRPVELQQTVYEVHSTTVDQQHKRVTISLAPSCTTGEHWFPFHNGTKTRFVQGECFTGFGFKI
jgi:hypothetical protein